MHTDVRQVIDRLETRLRQEQALYDSIGTDGLRERMHEFMLAVGPETGQFINILAKAHAGIRILELGTSVGYSTLWLAEAAREIGGHVTTIEKAENKQAEARAHIEEAGLSPYVTFILGDAVAWLQELPGPWDFVLLDLWKELYMPCFERLYGKLAPGGMIVADNMREPPEFRPEAEAYQSVIRQKPDLDSVEVGVGYALEVTRKHAEQVSP